MSAAGSHIYLLTQAVERAAARYPDQTAIRCGEASLTYAQLAVRMEALARCLRHQGVERGDRVGILQHKSLESIVAAYGIMRAGAAYVPLDAAAPMARLSSMISACGVRCVIADAKQVGTLRAIRATGVRLDCMIGVPDVAELGGRCVSWNEVATHDAGVIAVDPIDEDIAYILHTSGSTGTPKGIVHTHRSALAFARWAHEEFGLHAGDVLSNHAPLHFDLSTFDFFAGALAAATTVMLPEALVKLPASASLLLEEAAISVWYSVPLALTRLLRYGQLEERKLESLRWVLFAGEPFPPKYLQAAMRALPRARFSNLYGPTETNVCTFYHVPLAGIASDDPVPIGRVCPNAAALVVDEDDTEVAPGETGELLVRGALVMQGYWHRQRDDSTFFRSDAGAASERIYYCTGDLVRRDAAGNYLLVGRRDRQVKTRGYRVELDEVEAALLSHQGVAEAAAIAVPDADGSNDIVAVVVSNGSCTLASVRDHAACLLPWFAIPARIVGVAELPRTSTGKIDRCALLRLHACEPACVAALN